MINTRWILWVVAILVFVAVGLVGVVFFQVIVDVISPSIPLKSGSSKSTQDPSLYKGVVVEYNGESHTYITQAKTIAEALSENGIVLQPDDEVTPPLDTPIQGPVTVTIGHGRPITVQTAQGEVKFVSSAETVGGALADGGLAPQGLDYSQPSFESQIPEDGRIHLVRVRLDMPMTMKLSPFETSYKPLEDLGNGKRKEIQAGQQGVIAQGHLLRYEDGKLISDDTIAEYTLSKPQERVVGYGTKVEKLTLDVPGGKIEYWQAVTMYATSYSPCRLGIPNHCNYSTANGTRLTKGIAAFIRADYNQYVGTAVYVPGYGIATIADIGAGVPGKRWIDLGFGEDDFETWARDVTVYFLWPPPTLGPDN